ncbi:hypothetical protein EBAPG3_008140 [Nitrosospira lacus]|uniref:Uncharacterized protein n=1 Tax=Nitrosospira lacus TaxID=1288494 RepID=A0A1W6SPL4_9PROT|nr:hypothetical protein [Nitrosospira lacus]ARO87739.1 hypothetical protein EBAPG3_008140 [Nitrosospira lacus]
MRAASILKPGKNCWRTERADRIAFLVDGAHFFRAFREWMPLYKKEWKVHPRLHFHHRCHCRQGLVILAPGGAAAEYPAASPD